MTTFYGAGKAHNSKLHVAQCRNISLLCILICCSLAAVRSASGQARESAVAGGYSLWVGAGVSGQYIQYGGLDEAGVTAVVDADTVRRLGLEGEGRWIEYHKTADVHVESYLGGLRYHFNYGRFQPYAKGLAGVGLFNFPYDYAHGSYLVVAPGGGVDYRLTRRWSVRALDVEYQYWPQFTFGAMSSVSATVGLRYRVF
jgi:hypothetical protein